jgi:hypothetical protein
MSFTTLLHMLLNVARQIVTLRGLKNVNHLNTTINYKRSVSLVHKPVTMATEHDTHQGVPHQRLGIQAVLYKSRRTHLLYVRILLVWKNHVLYLVCPLSNLQSSALKIPRIRPLVHHTVAVLGRR